MQGELSDFWRRVRQELDAVGMQAEVELAEPALSPLIDTWRVTLTGLDGVRFRAFLSIPHLEPDAEPLPAVLLTPGYGGDTQHTAMLGLCHEGRVCLLTVYPRGQGESAQYWQVPQGQTKLTLGLEDPERHYYRGAYADCMRGIDFLCSREEIDPQRIGVAGLSQGGGLTLATTALDRRVRVAVAHEPFLCNYPVAVETATTGPYLELIDYFRRHPKEREQALSTLATFDPLQLAPMINCPIFMTIGLADTTCPPETIRPVYDRIESLKGLVELPGAGHGWFHIYRQLESMWLGRFL